MPRLRIYSETLPFEEVLRPRTLMLLARYDLELVLAVRPWQLDELPRLAGALRDSGISTSVWPMLSDDEGRWASQHNAEAFAAFTMRVCDVLAARHAAPRDVLLDLEPPFAHARALASSLPRGVFRATSPDAREAAAQFARAEARLSRLVRDLEGRTIATSSAVWPLVALDAPASVGWQALLGTPVDALAPGHVSVMMYTSILEGWSRRTLRRRDVTSLLSSATSRVVRRWGEQGGISVGCVGTGAFADEPVYRGPAELAEDVAIARAAGCQALSLFDLGGVLARPPAEAWLDAFVSTGASSISASDEDLARSVPSVPAEGIVPASKRVRAARTLARGITWALATEFFARAGRRTSQ